MEQNNADDFLSTPEGQAFIQLGINAVRYHQEKWNIVRKLIERDIVNGAPALDIAKAVSLLQQGENTIYAIPYKGQR